MNKGNKKPEHSLHVLTCHYLT